MNTDLIIYATSDMHGNLIDPKTIPQCDVFIIAGDSCPWQTSHDMVTQSVWLDQVFKPWLKEIPASKVILIGGNHDFIMQTSDFRYWAAQHLWCDYLQDEALEYKGVLFYGTPWVPRLSRWAFHKDNNGLINAFTCIPEDTDVLITHGPPLGVNDSLGTGVYGEHVGCEELADELEARERRDEIIPVSIHGHIHEGRGYAEKWGTKFYNATHLNRDYEPVYDIVRIDLNDEYRG